MSKNEELERLRRENRALKERIRALEKQSASVEPEQPQSDGAAPFAASNYFSYLLAKLRQKSLFARTERVTRYFRNSLWVTRIFRFGVLAYQYLQAGAFVLLYTALFILIIPIVLSVSLLTLIVTLILRRRNADRLLAECGERVRFILIPSKDGFSPERIRAEAAKTPDETVLVVSPFFFRRRGLADAEEMYVCYRKEYENVSMIRKYFFFYLRRRMRRAEYFTVTETVLTEQEEEQPSC